MSASIHNALDKAMRSAKEVPFDMNNDKWILFSDHHRGRRDGADDFLICEPAYRSALEHYNKKSFTMALLGDVEEFWENPIYKVLLTYKDVMLQEKQFYDADRLYRIWGNHDDQWQFGAPISKHLHWLFPKIKVHEAVQLQLKDGDKNVGKLLLVHGHQGNLESDRYAWLSKIFVRYIWRNIQRVFKVPLSTPSKDLGLRSIHDKAMVSWAQKHKGQAIVCGHTHQAVFESMTKLDRMQNELDKQKEQIAHGIQNVKDISEILELEANIERIKTKYTTLKDKIEADMPRYFNTGCCSYSDGDITGIELENGLISLVKWSGGKGSQRTLLEQTELKKLFSVI